LRRKKNKVRLKSLGIDSYNEAVLFMRKDCHICRSEGFEVPARVLVTSNNKHILATLNTIEGDLLSHGEASLSTHAWEVLGAHEGSEVVLSHPEPLKSLSLIRSKVYGNKLNLQNMQHIVNDIVNKKYSDIHLATFLTACAGNRLDHAEIIDLTQAMYEAGETLAWADEVVVDKHCVGGLPGNRTTLIVVPIVTAFGMMMPKTSSRAITSPAGTADVMETLAPVNLNISEMQQVVEQEGGCIVWGGTVALSPADDILIRVERAMDLDGEGQLIASVLSKKIAAGSTHIVIDIPVGETAKIRSLELANTLKKLFEIVAHACKIHLKIIITDGKQPVGRGIGPALEARDILEVLQNKPHAPQDLRDRSLTIAGLILEFSPSVKKGEGKAIATRLLEEGKAWEKFQAICVAQGGLKTLPIAAHKQVITAQHSGRITKIDNRKLSKLAKLSGAPHAKAAGVDLHVRLDSILKKGMPLMTIYSDSKGELEYALSFLDELDEIIQMEVFK
jgi:thymidine phosphorylase